MEAYQNAAFPRRARKRPARKNDAAGKVGQLNQRLYGDSGFTRQGEELLTENLKRK